MWKGSGSLFVGAFLFQGLGSKRRLGINKLGLRAQSFRFLEGGFVGKIGFGGLGVSGREVQRCRLLWLGIWDLSFYEAYSISGLR